MPFHPLRPLMRPNFWPASPFPDTMAENLRNARSKWQLIHSGDTFFFFFHPPNMEIVSSERLRFCHGDKVITDCGPSWKIRAFAQEIPKQTFGSVLSKRESNLKFSGQRLRWPGNNTGTLGLLCLVFCLYLLSMCFIKHLLSSLGTLDRLQICSGGISIQLYGDELTTEACWCWLCFNTQYCVGFRECRNTECYCSPVRKTDFASSLDIGIRD